MSGRLQGKVALVTGGASGIGRASVELFACEGAQVVIADLNAEAGAPYARELHEQGWPVHFVETDVTDEAAVRAAFRFVDERCGPLHVLHNCAGGSTNDDAAVDQLSLDTIEQVLKLELQSAMLCSREAVPRMIEHGTGSIIHMASFVAFRGVFNIHAYSAAKGALVSLTRAMAGSYARQGIRVNAIAPGVALSERAASRIASANVGGTMNFSWDSYPFAMGSPRDIANIALFLASDESRMVNAQTVIADGGLSAY
ncbi:MAG: SDR family NAD(P)-dependent oxidoreductase [Mycobacteriales bacterium]